MALGCRGHAFPDLKVHAFAKDFKDSERSDGLARCGGNTLLQKEKSGSVTQFTYDHGCDTQAWLNHFINNISYLAHNLSWASVRNSLLLKKKTLLLKRNKIQLRILSEPSITQAAKQPARRQLAGITVQGHTTREKGRKRGRQGSAMGWRTSEIV
jgi:hypothetical protein